MSPVLVACMMMAHPASTAARTRHCSTMVAGNHGGRPRTVAKTRSIVGGVDVTGEDVRVPDDGLEGAREFRHGLLAIPRRHEQVRRNDAIPPSSSASSSRKPSSWSTRIHRRPRVCDCIRKRPGTPADAGRSESDPGLQSDDGTQLHRIGVVLDVEDELNRRCGRPSNAWP